MTLEKQQLMQCIKDLADRAVEVKENNIAINLFVLYAAGMTNSDGELGVWNEAFARAQLTLLNAETKEKGLDNPETPDKV